MRTVNVIELNVGGKRFHVKREDLSDSTYFNNMFDNASFSENESEEIIIDRSGETFRHILQYLRTGRIFANDENTLNKLKSEASYYGLKGLTSDIEDKQTQIKNYQDEFMLLDDQNLLTTKGLAHSHDFFQVISSFEVSEKQEFCFLDDPKVVNNGKECDHSNRLDIPMIVKKTLVRKYDNNSSYTH